MKVYLLALLLLLGLSGCGTTQVAQTPDQQRESALYLAQYQSSQLQHWQRLTGSYQGGEFTSSFIAYLDGESIAVISERFDLGAFGRGEIEFYYRDGALYLVKKRALELAATGELEPQQLLLILDSEGEPLLSQKKMAEQVLVVPALEVEGLLRHAQVLSEAVAGRQQAARLP